MRHSSLIALLLLSGCGLITDNWFEENIRDLDGDGAIAERFGGPDCRDNDPTITICDADGDGELAVAAGGSDCDDGDAGVRAQAVEICNNNVDDDCNGLSDDKDPGVDSNSQLSWFLDQDQDGFFDPDSKLLACERPSDNYFSPAEKLGVDCNDTITSINPAAEENCEAEDRNCNGEFYDNATIGATIYYIDSDGDGYGGPLFDLFCEGQQPENRVIYSGDCDDNNPNRNPGLPELANVAGDENCVEADDGDADQDGYGYSSDCNDQDPSVNPGAEEIGCNLIDNNCNGLIDDLSDAAENQNDPTLVWFLDADQDGYGDPDQPRLSCYEYNLFNTDERYVQNSTDCDDNNALIHPGANEIYYNNVDENCVPADDFDQDGDGYQSNDPNNNDCDDTNDAVHPGATEICNEIDDDCDGIINNLIQTEEFGLGQLYYQDNDGDQVGGSEWFRACEPLDGYVNDRGDCNDDDYRVRPGADEYCDDLDRNCDGFLTAGAINAQDLYFDQDGDLRGDPGQQLHTCAGEGLVTNDNDCDDHNPTIYLGAPELCDGVDSNCSGDLDSDDPNLIVPEAFYEDEDGDGFYADGAVEITVDSCDQVPENIAYVGGDCDDFNDNAYPGALEQCDGVDNDCDGQADTLDEVMLYFPDNDGDGDGDLYASGELSCAPRDGWSLTHTDCNDGNNQVYLGAPERCDLADNDCDGQIDEEVAAGEGNLYYRDFDGDHFGNPNDVVSACSRPYGYVGASLPYDESDPVARAMYDCDDTKARINPTKVLEWCDGLDNNCDGEADFSTDGSAFVVGGYYGPDLDQDGVTSESLVYCPDLVPLGYIEGYFPLDCDDTNDQISPWLQEVCGNNVDEDCSGDVDDGDYVENGYPVYVDEDGDGFTGTYYETTSCTETPNDKDCDDDNITVYKGAEEVCDGVDNDCNEQTDEDIKDYDPFGPLPFGRTAYVVDYDRDGYGPSDVINDVHYLVCDGQPIQDSYTPIDEIAGPDCNDIDPSIYPGAPESCNSVDSNCDGRTAGPSGILIGSGPEMFPTLGEVMSSYTSCSSYPFRVEDGYTIEEDTLVIASAEEVSVISQGGGRYTWISPPPVHAVEVSEGGITISNADFYSEDDQQAIRLDSTFGASAVLFNTTFQGCAIWSDGASLYATDLYVNGCTDNAFELHNPNSNLVRVEVENSNLGLWVEGGQLTLQDTHLHDLTTGVRVANEGTLLLTGARIENTTDLAIQNDYSTSVYGLIASNTSGVHSTSTAISLSINHSRLVNNNQAAITLSGGTADVHNTVLQGGDSAFEFDQFSPGVIGNNLTIIDTSYGVFSSVAAPVHLTYTLFWDVFGHFELGPALVTGDYVYSNNDLSPYSNLTNTVLLAQQPEFTHYDPLDNPLFWDLHPAPTDTVVLNQDPAAEEFDNTAADVGLSTGVSFSGTGTYYDDTDLDGVSDYLEIFWFGSLTWTDGSSDLDGDGIIDRDELFNYTDPLDPTSY